MDVIAVSPWAWTLYAEGPRRFLCVLCGTSAQYELAIELQPAEVEAIRGGGEAAVDRLAKQVADRPSMYWARRIDGFTNQPSVRKAARRRPSP